MDIFPGPWPSTLMNNYNHGTIDQHQSTNQVTEQQDSEWAGFLRNIDLEGLTDVSEFEQHFRAPSNGYPVQMSGVGFRPNPIPVSMGSSMASSTGSSTLSPPSTSAHPMQAWPVSNGSVMAYPPTSIYEEPWNLHQTHAFHGNHDPSGLCIQVPTPPQTATFQQGPNVDPMFYDAHPQTYIDDDIVQGEDDQPEYSVPQSTFIDDTMGTDGDDEADAADPCYAQLLYRCLLEAPDHTLSLKELYEWISQHSQKAKDPKSRGWQNSVRHNLSMNAAFEKATANTTKKGSLWRLTDQALREGVISTTRYRKDPKRKHDRKGQPALKRQISGARGGQATRAATRRIKEMHQARSTPYTSAAERHRHDHRRGLESGFLSPLSMHSARPSPQPSMLSPSPASPYSFGIDQMGEDYGIPEQPLNPYTPPQLPLKYDPVAKPALENFELQHIDYTNGGFFGDTDPETPSLATDTSFMSDDGRPSMLSPVMSREPTNAMY